MIKARTHEKYAVICLIVFIISLIWFRNSITTGINNALSTNNNCSGSINSHNNRKHILNKYLN